MKEETFDLRGQICPSTLLIALKKINESRDQLKNGECTVCFLTNNRDSLSTIPEYVDNMGYSCNVENFGDHYEIKVFKGK